MDLQKPVRNLEIERKWNGNPLRNSEVVWIFLDWSWTFFDHGDWVPRRLERLEALKIEVVASSRARPWRLLFLDQIQFGLVFLPDHARGNWVHWGAPKNSQASVNSACRTLSLNCVRRWGVTQRWPVYQRPELWSSQYGWAKSITQECYSTPKKERPHRVIEQVRCCSESQIFPWCLNPVKAFRCLHSNDGSIKSWQSAQWAGCC